MSKNLCSLVIINSAPEELASGPLTTNSMNALVAASKDYNLVRVSNALAFCVHWHIRPDDRGNSRVNALNC